MDFRRSAIVLIVCFFFLDVFLFGLVWQKKVESKTPLNTSINVIDQMKQDGITLPSLTSTDETAPIIQLTPVSIESGLNNLQNQIVSLEKKCHQCRVSTTDSVKSIESSKCGEF